MKAKQMGALILIIIMIFSMLAAFFTTTEEPVRIKKDFNTLKNALKLVPSSPFLVQFASVENIKGTELERLIRDLGALPPYEQYRAIVTKALIADYLDRSWVELHEVNQREVKLNYTSTYSYHDLEVKITPQGLAIVTETSPIIFGFSGRVNETMDLMLNNTNWSAYQTFLPLMARSRLNADFALIRTQAPYVYDAYYIGTSYAGKNSYQFEAVLHLNRSANESDLNGFKSNLLSRELYAKPRNFTYYIVNFELDYAVVNATGSFQAVMREFEDLAR
ncbi:MAG: hypothetical protein QXL78_00630 [Methanocellales archaeon]